MGVGVSKDVPEAQYKWTYSAKRNYNDTQPVVSGDGSTVALYSRGEKQVLVLDAQGTTIARIPLKQKMLMQNVSAIPSLTHDGSRIVVRDSHSVCMYSRSGSLMWEYERKDKMVRSGMQSWIAQVSANGAVVIVRMFHELIWLDGNTGNVTTIVQTRHQMANTIPRISDDGSVVVVCDGPMLFCYRDARLAWEQQAPQKDILIWNKVWMDPALSADGSRVACVCKHSLHVFETKTGTKVTVIDDARHAGQENSCEASFSGDGQRLAMVCQPEGVRVLTGQAYETVMLEYQHKGPHRPVAPMLSRNGNVLTAKVYDTILIWNVSTGNPGPATVARVRDASHIPGGPTVHTRDYHHDRDTHIKRTYSCSYDGNLCVAVAKHKELWAFNLNEAAHVGHGGAFN